MSMLTAFASTRPLERQFSVSLIRNEESLYCLLLGTRKQLMVDF